MANAQAIEHILSQVANATLADMASSFASSFLGQDIFTAACHLYMVYRDEERSPISNTILGRRIAILYILCTLYGPDRLDKNPFLSFFLELMDTLNEHQPERLVVQCILSGATEPLQSFSAVELVDNLDRSIPIATVDVQRLHNLQVIEQQLVGLGGDSQLAGIAHTHAHLSTKQHQKHNVTIDPTLMNAAFTSPLSIAQQETLLHMIESDPENLKNHLPLDQLPDLIEQNQAIAIEALNVLAETPEFSE
ncbi:unnamed protein product [Umbelopsis sp. WA50703]